jgi:hypothetical protein
MIELTKEEFQRDFPLLSLRREGRLTDPEKGEFERMRKKYKIKSQRKRGYPPCYMIRVGTDLLTYDTAI